VGKGIAPWHAVRLMTFSNAELERVKNFFPQTM
jgi:hypothetical protein